MFMCASSVESSSISIPSKPNWNDCGIIEALVNLGYPRPSVRLLMKERISSEFSDRYITECCHTARLAA